MIRRLGLVVLVGAAVLLPASGAWARGYGRYANTPPQTPFGPAYDPTTWRQAGYNPAVYEQLMMQKMAAAQQQMMMKQMQMMQKQQQQQNGGKTKGQGQATPGTGFMPQQTITPPRRLVKKKGKKAGSTTTTSDDSAKPTDAKGTDGAKDGAKPTASTSAKPASTTTTAANKPKN